MATEKRIKRPTLTSPKGTFRYPKLTKPDFGNEKFPKPDGEYNVQLVVKSPQEDPVILAFVNRLMPFVTEAEREAMNGMADMKIAARKALEAKGGLVANPLYSVVYDQETEEETGEITFKFAAKASGKRKDDSVWTRKPGLFDARGKPLPRTVEIWGGTVGKVSFEPSPYFIPGSGAWGLKLALNAVQVLELVSAGNRSAASYGFEEEEGFDASDLPAEDDTPAAATAEANGSSDDGNF